MRSMALSILLLMPCMAHAVDLSQPDKQLHLMAGCAISIFTWGVVKDLEVKNAAVWGVSAGIGAGMLKEIYDYYYHPPYTADAQDTLAAAIGSLACVSIVEGVSLVVHKNTVEIKAKF